MLSLALTFAHREALENPLRNGVDVDCGFLPCFSQALCNLNLRSVSSLDIVIPGLNSSTDVQARINAGESIHIIRGTKGEPACPPVPCPGWEAESVHPGKHEEMTFPGAQYCGQGPNDIWQWLTRRELGSPHPCILTLFLWRIWGGFG